MLLYQTIVKFALSRQGRLQAHRRPNPLALENSRSPFYVFPEFGSHEL
jgi:hypothetical protein